ncbi:MAG: hypothetical protein AAF289_20485 [Cyanobacteria bacterium P01_A01_bin.135]
MPATTSSSPIARATEALPRGTELLRWLLGALTGVAMAACQSSIPRLVSSSGPQETGSQPVIQQQWQLQPGSMIGERAVVAGLGDVSIALEGGSVYAPFSGVVQPIVQPIERCALFTSPDLPAYSARLCGLRRIRSGAVQRGDRIGSGQILHFAALRKQPDGTWAIVEPSQDLVSRFLIP